MHRSRWFVLTSLAATGSAAAAGSACTRGESRPVDSTAAGTRSALETVALTPGVPDPGVHATRPAYRGAPVTGGGSVTGTVTLDGPPPVDSPADGTFAAADSAERADPTLVRTCGRAGGRRGPGRAPTPATAGGVDGVDGAVVWLEGVGAGKPMPADRRYELALDGCRLAPQALGAAAGGTLNVHGVDALPSRLVFARAGAGAEAGRVLLRTAMSAPGQVVPDERVLAEPGLVEVRGERPSWLRAWIVAFDHPYFTAAGAGGAFTLADVPPGRYTLVAWHPRLGRAEQAVTVVAGQVAAARVALRGEAEAR